MKNKFRTTIKKTLAVLVFAMGCGCIYGQDQMLKLEDCIYMNYEVFPKSPSNLQWIEGTNNYSYIKNDTLFMGKIDGKKDKVITTLSKIRKAMYAGKDATNEELGRLPYITWLSPNEFTFGNGYTLYKYNVKSNTVTKLNTIPGTEGLTNIDKSNIKNMYAYTIDNDLFIVKDSQEITVAKSENEGVCYGAEDVHRNEFGIEKGTFWSPKDNYLAFYRMDESMVADYPLVEIGTRIATTENIKYPMAGETSHEVTLGVYNIETGNTVYMKTTGPKDQYLTTITWDPSEKYIYIGVLNREQNHLQFNKYDVATGELVKTLFEERDEQYVEPQVGPHFIFSNPTRFVYESRRDGWNHLYLYDTDGNMIQQLTKGEWEVQGIIGIDAKEENIFITSTQESPIESHIYAVNIPMGYTRKITKAHGTHSGRLSSTKKYIIDSYSSTDVARCIDIIDVDFKENKLSNNYKVVKNISKDVDPLENYAIGEMKIGTLMNEDGDSLYYQMILPPDFDPNKKYPVFHYVYGGPHMQLITDSWTGGAGLWAQRWAQRGYIYFSLDNRGTPNRGADFEQCIHRQLGTLETEDQMVGINFLKSLSYVDADRIAIDGWSYGGFMTMSMMLRNPDVYKVGACGGPVVDWKWYEVMYGERYMDTPQENPEGYEKASLLSYVDNLKGKLLIIHCTTDPVVVWQHSLSIIDAFIKSGTQVDYFVYPGHDHNVMGRDRMHLYEKIENYIDSNINN